VKHIYEILSKPGGYKKEREREKKKNKDFKKTKPTAVKHS
jgi:hypothetical protein